MRSLTVASILTLALLGQSARGQEHAMTGSNQNSSTVKVFSAEQSAAMAEASRKKADAIDRARDVKLKRATTSICIGC